ncbi:MAG: type I methionyl aminopeptidase [Clostridiales Family XIII bacterium]|jgi:methionyl aminopeptidase|nr:type I methionyl aminopeptidase [Clostridiales Family XIII bacterium]
MILLKTREEIEQMKVPARVTGSILFELREFIKPGISTKDIDDFVVERIRQAGMTASFLGYNGFPASCCTSVNEEIVHGIPDASRILKEGDIVSVDVGTTGGGWVSDAARTYPVGTVSEEAARLMDTCKRSFFAGLAHCRVGYRLSDIGSAIQDVVEADGFSVVRDFVGHGVGRDMHEDPQVKNYGAPNKGPKLMAGMTLAIEPMINAGTYETEVLLNNWTAVATDGKLSAHYENTVVITEEDPLVITLDEREGTGV